MFDGLDEFDVFDIKTAATTIHGRRGGDGPPVLLLHGIPETHLMWHRVAPRLAAHCTVVATDLRGFGDSGTPPTATLDDEHDRADHGRRRITCPTLVLWSGTGAVAAWHQPLEV